MTNHKINSPDPTYLLEEGMIIDEKWEIQNFIAKGGKGEVYLARQMNLDRQVALKIMSGEFILSLEGDQEEITSETMRFRREVKLMARMQHPNILQVYDFDHLEMDGMDLDYIVMEYVPGPTLRQEMPEKGLGHDEKKVRKWLEKYFFPILDGMKAVHNKGIVHRDMKPENVLIDDGLPKIMDFGIAGGYHMDNVTQTHHMLGTMKYMPEEQFLDLALTDVRVDVYALGKILYEVVDGKMKKGRNKPFHSVALNEPKTRFFKTLDQIIQQATARNRNHRIPCVKSLRDSLDELVMDLEENKQPGAVSYKYWKYLSGISIAVIIIFVTAVIMHHKPAKKNLDISHTQNQSEIKMYQASSLIQPEFNFKAPRPTKVPDMDKANSLPENILASDDMTMVLLTGSDVSMLLDDPASPERKQIKKTLPVKSVYMDRTKITNHLYVRFLNEVDGIEVQNRSVLRKGKLLLLLGEVREGYEPIHFRGNRFTATPEDVLKPVVRVTPFGALAYASFYGKSLPLMKQWWLAVKSLGKQTSQQKISSFSRTQMMQMMDGGWMMGDQSAGSVPLARQKNPGIQSVIPVENIGIGIQGLKQNVNEWTMSFAADGSLQFHIHGGIGELGHGKSYLERQPWEAFSSVGFRTVLNLDRGK